MILSHPTPFRLQQAGFTLVEMAIVMLIVALLLGGLAPTLSSQMDQKNLNETRKQLDEIQQALVGYAVVNGRLPCPATLISKGAESFASGGTPPHSANDGVCSNFYAGFVPAATLGLQGANDSGLIVDAWGNPIRYAVTLWNYTFTKSDGMRTTGLANISPASFSFLLVCASATGITTSPPSCGTGGTSLTSTPGVPAIVFSTGKNGGQAGGTNVDELANIAGTRVFISHGFIQDGFDDLVAWVSPNILLNRMVMAGKLP